MDFFVIVDDGVYDFLTRNSHQTQWKQWNIVHFYWTFMSEYNFISVDNFLLDLSSNTVYTSFSCIEKKQNSSETEEKWREEVALGED